jgi:hypothetical protein
MEADVAALLTAEEVQRAGLKACVDGYTATEALLAATNDALRGVEVELAQQQGELCSARLAAASAWTRWAGVLLGGPHPSGPLDPCCRRVPLAGALSGVHMSLLVWVAVAVPMQAASRPRPLPSMTRAHPCGREWRTQSSAVRPMHRCSASLPWCERARAACALL